jgi:hypothetical protein
MLGILTGIGLMTINNIGNDVSNLIAPVPRVTFHDMGNGRLKPFGTLMTAKSTNHLSRNDN